MDLFHTDSCHLPGFSHSVMASPVGAVQDTYSVEAVGESRRFPAVCRLNIYTHKKRDDESQVVPTKKHMVSLITNNGTQDVYTCSFISYDFKSAQLWLSQIPQSPQTLNPTNGLNAILQCLHQGQRICSEGWQSASLGGGGNFLHGVSTLERTVGTLKKTYQITKFGCFVPKNVANRFDTRLDQSSVCVCVCVFFFGSHYVWH